MEFQQFIYQTELSITTLSNELLACAENAGKSTQKSLAMQRITEICLTLAKDILQKRYQTGEYTRFAICDPKLREIYAPEFRDRLVQSWLVGQIEPIIEKELIEDTFANRLQKGTLKALSRTQTFMRRPNNAYYLQLDIQNFFNSIHRPTLAKQWFEVLQKHQNKSPQFYSQSRYCVIKYLSSNILNKDITQNPYVVSGCKALLSDIPKHKQLSSSPADTGLPIGAITSQLFANLYLSPLDHFAKHTLKIKGYTRYMDDIFITGESAQILHEWKAEIAQFLTQLKLNLHPTKQHLNLCKLGADYLGYKIYPHYRHLRTRNIKKTFRWLRFFNELASQSQSNQPVNFTFIPNDEYWISKAKQPNSTIDYLVLQKMQAVINSYLSLLTHANQYQLRKRLYHKNFKLLTQWFIPKNAQYTSVKIKKRVLHEYLRSLF